MVVFVQLTTRSNISIGALLKLSQKGVFLSNELNRANNKQIYMIIKITKDLLTSLSHEARQSPRKRKNYNFHTSYEDPINRMLNAFEPHTYVRPHKHENPDKIEIFILLKGRVLIVEFDNGGTVIDHVILDSAEGNNGVEIPPRTWHTLISLQQGSVLYEVKQGPYIQLSDKNFAAWAPDEGNPDRLKYNDSILEMLCVK